MKKRKTYYLSAEVIQTIEYMSVQCGLSQNQVIELLTLNYDKEFLAKYNLARWEEKITS